MQCRRNARATNGGWTLIELLIIVAIIGILAAIAVVQWSTEKRKAFDARAEHDLRNAATCQEAYYLENAEYITCTNCDSASLPGFQQSPEVTVDMAANGESFTGTAFHPKGSTTFAWNSAEGGLQ